MYNTLSRRESGSSHGQSQRMSKKAGSGGRSLRLFKTKWVETERSAILCDIPNRLFRCPVGKLGLNLECDLNVGVYELRQMLDNLVGDLTCIACDSQSVH
jgi:hypothetical protein